MRSSKRRILTAFLTLQMAISIAHAQVRIPITFEGEITDREGQPVPGAVVSIGGSEVVTGAEGRFKLKVLVESAALEVKAYLKNAPEIQVTKRFRIVGTQPSSVPVNLALPFTLNNKVEAAGRPSIRRNLPYLPPPPEAHAVPLPLPPPPSVAAEALPPPPARTAKDLAVVRVLYATDRKPSGQANPDEFYTGERQEGGELHLGACDVSIPILHERGTLESPSLLRFEWSEERGKHVVILKVTQANSKAEFMAALQQEIEADPGKQLLVFVHGFNVAFSEAARRTAQISYDLNFTGAPVLYSWPSRAEVSAYNADEATVDWARPHFQAFLEDLARESGARRIFVLAHSMGSRVVARAVDGLVRSRELSSLPAFKEVVLAAPDIDKGELEELAAGLKSAAGRVTVYANSKDEAIKLSSEIHRAPRAGSSGDDIFLVDGIDSIDATDTDTGFLRHSYYANAILLKDLFVLFQGDTAPPRTGMSRKTRGTQAFWVLEPQPAKP